MTVPKVLGVDHAHQFHAHLDTCKQCREHPMQLELEVGSTFASRHFPSA